MLIKGEKYACDACIRGHRVSTCQHHGTLPSLLHVDLTTAAAADLLPSDRPLTHINKKGRPVSQCPHCRGLRKARATHVKCECGEKTHTKAECGHLDKSDTKNWLHGDTGSDGSGDQYHTCCCSHGLRCTCALKKDHLDTVPEMDPPEGSPTSDPEVRKPRLTSVQSETTLTVFTNGHHKPVHKHNDMAHKCGAPYKIPRSHTIHGHSDLAQRSMDSLPLTKRALLSHEALPHHDSITSAPQPVRLVKSEHGSPEIKPLSNLEPLNTSIPPLDSAYSPYDSGSPVMLPFGYERFHDNYFAPHDVEPSLNSAGLNAPSVDWSTFGIPYDNPAFAETSQPPSYASFDYSNLGHPGPTTSSSGDISEAEDYCNIPAPRQTSQDITDISSVGDASEDNAYRLSSASSYMGLPQATMLASNNLESLDIDDFLKNAEAQTSVLEQINTTVSMDSTKTYATQPDLDLNGSQSLGQLGDSYLEDDDASLQMNNAYSNPLLPNPYDSFGSDEDNNNEQTPQAVWRS